jgi:hypothetical protein
MLPGFHAVIFAATEVHYGIEGYADLPLIVVALVCACYKAFYGSRLVWLLACSLVFFTISHAMVYAFFASPAFGQTMWILHGYVGTAGWLLLAIYCASLVVRRFPQRNEVGTH